MNDMKPFRDTKDVCVGKCAGANALTVEHWGSTSGMKVCDDRFVITCAMSRVESLCSGRGQVCSHKKCQHGSE